MGEPMPAWLLADAGLVGDPVRLPRPAAVSGQRLLEMRMVRRGRRPTIANQLTAIGEIILGVELADAILELPDLRDGKNAVAMAGPVEIPLLRLGVERAQRETHIGLTEIRAAVPDAIPGESAIIVDPGIGAGRQTLEVILPLAEDEIEVMPRLGGIRDRLFGRVGHARLIRDPVHFPCLPPVRGESLLEVGRVGVRLRPDEPDEDALPIERVLRVKLALPIRELSDLRHDHDAVLRIGPIESPLVRRRVICSKSEPFDMTAGAIRLELLDLRGAVPQEPRGAGAVELDPLIGSGQWVQPALEVDMPMADLEVEIMLAIALRHAVAGGQRTDTQGGGRQRTQGNEYSHARDLAEC